MSISTVTSSRYRSESVTFKELNIADLATAYNAFEVTQAADTGFTYQVRIMAAGFDGEKYWIIAEKVWPEIADDPLGQVPELP